MALASAPLTSLSEAQRAQAQERFTIICSALEKEITQTEVARTHQLSLRAKLSMAQMRCLKTVRLLT
jgi:hypothetical protein